MTPQLSILADLGGTNTRVALADGKVVRPDSIARFSNAEYAARGQDVTAILRDYLAQTGAQVEGVCVAAAGPVQDGVARMTNLDWVIDDDGLRAATGARQVAILNDLQAQGHALGHIADANLRVVVDGSTLPGGRMLVMGLGTGVNAAVVHDTPMGRIVPPSECGHITMPVRGDEDLALAQFVAARSHGFAGVEDVLAGRGLEHIDAFVGHQAGTPTSRTSAEVMAALTAGEAQAEKTAAIYIRLLGQELGNLGLIHMPFGGLFLIGGMARALTPWFGRMGLTAHFRDKGRFAGFMEQVRVSVVEDDFAALTGCAAYLTANA